MKTLKKVLKNYNDYRTIIDDKFGARLCQFLTPEQIVSIGLTPKIPEPSLLKKWTEENILQQLYDDVMFGWQKACDGRGITSSLMFCVVLSWCDILENKFKGFPDIQYSPYGKPLFKAVADLYQWTLPVDPEDEEDSEE